MSCHQRGLILAELQPNFSTKLVASLLLVFQHEGSGPTRLPPPTVKVGRGGAETVPCTGTVPIRNASTILRVILRGGLCANLKPAVFHMYQQNMKPAMPRRGPNSYCSLPVTLSTLFGVRFDTAVLTTTASAL